MNSFLACGICGTACEIQRPDEHSVMHWCPVCKRGVFVYLDQGKLDLGIVRDSKLTDVWDYELRAYE